jgi:hypothetical protein
MAGACRGSVDEDKRTDGHVVDVGLERCVVVFHQLVKLSIGSDSLSVPSVQKQHGCRYSANERDGNDEGGELSSQWDHLCCGSAESDFANDSKVTGKKGCHQLLLMTLEGYAVLEPLKGPIARKFQYPGIKKEHR